MINVSTVCTLSVIYLPREGGADTAKNNWRHMQSGEKCSDKYDNQNCWDTSVGGTRNAFKQRIVDPEFSQSVFEASKEYFRSIV